MWVIVGNVVFEWKKGFIPFFYQEKGFVGTHVNVFTEICYTFLQILL